MVKKSESKSLNPLEISAKTASGELLLNLVADASVMYGHVKTAHWNLRGRNFLGIHRLLDEVAESVLKGIDEMAERARQLGLTVDGNLGALSKKSTLKAFPSGLVDSETVVKELGASMATCIQAMHDDIDKADEAGDAITADLLTKISGGLELQLWLLESHLGE